MRMVLFLSVSLFLCGCTVKKDFVPIGGSRADGTVKLGFSHGVFESPEIDREQAISAAKGRCAAWGYKGAEPFGAVMKQCVSASSAGCNRWNVIVDFQCTGSQAAPAN
jgi:YecR-like lipoprotein